MAAFFAVWGRYTFVGEDRVVKDEIGDNIHNWSVPLGLTVFYVVSLPLLRLLASRFLSDNIDVKLLLRESMILYNAGQVLLNGWMVYRFLDALVFRDHPFIGGSTRLVDTGASFAVWVHYCDKYLEFFDTYFMVLRGNMNQVSFLHVYHHITIAWAWWIGLKVYPGGDIYFGALFNSFIHVLMYSYYALSLLKIPCPWKKILTQAQLIQFVSVVAYSPFSAARMPMESPWTEYVAYYVQCFEMISLFILFALFYRKAYAKRAAPAKRVSSSASTSTRESDNSTEETSISSIDEFQNESTK